MEECAVCREVTQVTPVREAPGCTAEQTLTRRRRSGPGAGSSVQSRGVAAAGFVYMIRIYRLGGSPPAGAAP